ncbi:MAG TPA: hypothetical protein VGA70_05910 [Longimicrobiales bacterium]|jgi:hypothetical protein
MAVARSCNPGNGAVDLAVSAGEYLEYTVPSADANVRFALAESGGGSLFDNTTCPPPCAFRWPAQGTAIGAGEARHTLSMQFFGDERLAYRVVRRSAVGSVLEVVKDCAFENTGGPDEYFEPLRVFVS